MADAAKMTPIEPGLIARVAAGVRYAFTGKAPDWFGPQAPLPAVAPAEVAGRQMDYPVGYNLHQQPRSGEAVSFAQMRALADGYDLMRLIIETRKDQLAKLKWTIKPKEKTSTAGSESDKPDARCDQLVAFFQSPDKEHDWNTWLRMLLEDLLVIDAPTIYPRKTRGGGLYALEPIDGATIKRVLDQHGRTPLPPDPAYQQVLKGLPAVDYTREELVYQPRNPRTHKVYGYSPVEQVIVTVNIALRRQAHQLSFYTEGSTPDLIFQVPETWNADQIRQFEDWWNSVLSGNSAERRKTRFVPKGVEPFDTKSAALKDEMDEWLARIICYAFSVSPQPFVKEMNRATAQTGQEAALAEGLAPLQEWVKALIDLVIVRHFGWADLEFCWEEETAIKPLEQAQINKIYVEAKVLHPDEVRADLGKPPLTPQQKEEMNPPPPPQAGDEPVGEKAPPPSNAGGTAGKVEKSAKKALRPIDRERTAVVRARAKVSTTIERFLAKLAANLVDLALHGETTKDDEGGMDYSPSAFEDAINRARWDLLAKDLRKKLKALARDGVVEGFGQLGADLDELPGGVLKQANQRAIAYADNRAAEMVGMKWVDGELVENPDARWRIDETTRRKVNELVTTATEEGWAADKLATALQEHSVFGEARATMIARTECAWADVEGNLAAYHESGMVGGKRSVLGTNENHGEWDIANAKAGVIGLDEAFPSGHQAPPYHPYCICDLLPVLDDEMPVLLGGKEALAKGYNTSQPRDSKGRFASASAFVAGKAPVDLINATLGTTLTPGNVRFSAKMHEKLQTKHRDDYQAVMKHMTECLTKPDYIGTHPDHPGKIMLVKKVEGLGKGKPAMIVAVVGAKDSHGHYPGASAYGLTMKQLMRGMHEGYLKKTKAPQ
jgi:hypothetical protein